jgi:hypothetical protein
VQSVPQQAPSNTEDDEEEDSHSSAVSSESEQETDDGGGKQEAGAYKEEEVDTDEEVTSLTSAKAKITKNKFMAIHMRNTTTGKVFCAVKFLNTPPL